MCGELGEEDAIIHVMWKTSALYHLKDAECDVEDVHC